MKTAVTKKKMNNKEKKMNNKEKKMNNKEKQMNNKEKQMNKLIQIYNMSNILDNKK